MPLFFEKGRGSTASSIPLDVYSSNIPLSLEGFLGCFSLLLPYMVIASIN
jgi:hypothetical protein